MTDKICFTSTRVWVERQGSSEDGDIIEHIWPEIEDRYESSDKIASSEPYVAYGGNQNPKNYIGTQSTLNV